MCLVKCWFPTKVRFKHPMFKHPLKPWIPFSFLSAFFCGGGSFATFLLAFIWGDFSFVSAGWVSFSSSRSLWWISAATWLYKSNISVRAMFMKYDNHLDLVLRWFHWNPGHLSSPIEHTLQCFTETEARPCPGMRLPPGPAMRGCSSPACSGRILTLPHCHLQTVTAPWWGKNSFLLNLWLRGFNLPVLPSSCYLLAFNQGYSLISVFLNFFFYYWPPLEFLKQLLPIMSPSMKF